MLRPMNKPYRETKSAIQNAAWGLERSSWSCRALAAEKFPTILVGSMSDTDRGPMRAPREGGVRVTQPGGVSKLSASLEAIDIAAEARC